MSPILAEILFGAEAAICLYVTYIGLRLIGEAIIRGWKNRK